MKKPNGFTENQTDIKKPDNEDDNEDDNDNKDDNDLLLKKEQEEKKLQKCFIECLNSFNTNAISECIAYLEDLPFEVIEYVLKKTSRITSPNWRYAQKILDDYIKRKIDTIEKVRADNFKNKDRPAETREEMLARKTKELEEALNNGNR